MKRRIVVAAVVALMTASAYAGEGARTKTSACRCASFFDRAPGVIREDANDITAGPMQVDVIVARIDTDGKLVKACVDSEEAARRFFEAPIETIDGRRAKEH
jgi:hypothetical protein